MERVREGCDSYTIPIFFFYPIYFLRRIECRDHMHWRRSFHELLLLRLRLQADSKNITVTSYLLTTGDHDYVNITIIDAQGLNQVVHFEHDETESAVLMGNRQ